MSSRRTDRKSRSNGSIRNCCITQMELREYRQTGAIRIKEVAASGCSFHPWDWGFHNSINFKDLLFAKEADKIVDGWKFPLSSQIVDTVFGQIAIETFPDGYFVHTLNYRQKQEILHEVGIYGYEARSAGARKLWIKKPRKQFAAYRNESDGNVI